MKEQQEKYNLPEGWIWTTIGDIAILSSGGTPDRGNRSYFNGDIPWVKSGELNRGIITKTEENITLEALENSSAKIVPSGTLLIALYGSTVGKLAFLGINATTNQAVAALKTTNSFESKYLYYYLLHNRERLLQKRVGGAQPNISLKILQIFPIPLASLFEQKIVVRQIESLFSKLDEAEKGLRISNYGLKIYRQALLKDAFTGKLTNKNVIEGKLPDGWKIIIISTISNVVRGGSPRPAGDLRYYEGNIPFLKVKDLTKDEKVHLTTFEYTIKEAGLVKTRIIRPGTLLLSNSGATLGIPKICLIDSTINDGIAAFLDLDDRSIYYLYYFFLFNTQKLRDMSMGATQPNLNTTIIKNIKLPYCSFDEQKHVVEIIESRFTLVENLEKTVNSVLNEITALRHSILKKAFEGKLVNYTSDESVENLLKNIQKEKRLYLENQKELNRSKPKQNKKMEEKKSILNILKESNLPISAQVLWEKSTSEGDIERFYSEIKEIYDQIDELKSETESLLTLKDENK